MAHFLKHTKTLWLVSVPGEPGTHVLDEPEKIESLDIAKPVPEHAGLMPLPSPRSSRDTIEHSRTDGTTSPSTGSRAVSPTPSDGTDDVSGRQRAPSTSTTAAQTQGISPSPTTANRTRNKSGTISMAGKARGESGSMLSAVSNGDGLALVPGPCMFLVSVFAAAGLSESPQNVEGSTPGPAPICAKNYPYIIMHAFAGGELDVETRPGWRFFKVDIPPAQNPVQAHQQARGAQDLGRGAQDQRRDQDTFMHSCDLVGNECDVSVCATSSTISSSCSAYVSLQTDRKLPPVYGTCLYIRHGSLPTATEYTSRVALSDSTNATVSFGESGRWFIGVYDKRIDHTGFVTIRSRELCAEEKAEREAVRARLKAEADERERQEQLRQQAQREEAERVRLEAEQRQREEEEHMRRVGKKKPKEKKSDAPTKTPSKTKTNA